jgi:tetratricopeptide (TPR) repeat protein
MRGATRPTLLIPIGLLCGAALASVSSQELARAAKLSNKGVRALRTGRVEKAREAFEAALRVIPDFPGARIGMGQIAMSEADFELALEQFEIARDGYRELGEDLLDIEARRYAEAQRQINALQDSILHLQTRITAGSMVQIQIQEMSNRITQLQAIAPPGKNSAGEPPGEIYFHIGNALFQLGRTAEALEAWETCRDRNPAFALVHNNLAHAYVRMERFETARDSLDKAEELGFPIDPLFKQELDREIAERRAGTAG